MSRNLCPKPNGFIVYQGPSMLDGKPIVAIALTGSSNRKTGDMVQTYIIRQDVKPTEAVRSGADVSICGDCKHRPSNGGACYVVVAQGPTVVYKQWQAGKYPHIMGPDELATIGQNRMVRLGTYGDPMAVPAEVWQTLVSKAQGRTGYTHQWANAAIPQAQRDAISALCMASVDNPEEAAQAQQSGKRYFRIRLASESLAPREFVCPASDEAGKRKTCATCGACNGSEKATAGSPVIIAHGVSHKVQRYAAQRIPQGV